MTFVELFFHCDRHGCEAHSYVPGEQVKPGEASHALPKEIPDGWSRDERGRDFCSEHTKVNNGEATVQADARQ